MPKKKAEQVFIRELEGIDSTQIHITGTLLPNSAFLKILNLMKAYQGRRQIVFVVYDANMMRLIRECMPSECYDRIELYSQKMLDKEWECAAG